MIFQRSVPPYLYRDYSDYRPLLRRDFRYRCAYCLMHKYFLAGEAGCCNGWNLLSSTVHAAPNLKVSMKTIQVRTTVTIGGIREGDPPMLDYHKIATRPDGKRRLFAEASPTGSWPPCHFLFVSDTFTSSISGGISSSNGYLDTPASSHNSSRVTSLL